MLPGRFNFNFEEVYLAAQKKRQEEKLEDELSSFAQLLRQHYELKLFLEDPRIAAAYKKKMMLKLFPPELSTSFRAIIDKLIDNGREELVGGLAQKFTKRLAKEKKIIFVQVASVCQLPDKLKNRLARDLEKWRSVPVKIRYSLEPELLGGLRLRFIDGVVWDVSLKRKLTRLKEVILE